MSGAGSDPGLRAFTESYNGSSWTELNDLNLARSYIGGGNMTQTSALAIGGQPPASRTETELWNGTNCTEVNDLNQGRYGVVSAGADSTSALAAGGYYSPPATRAANTESS